jgi:hypothetical protein
MATRKNNTETKHPRPRVRPMAVSNFHGGGASSTRAKSRTSRTPRTSLRRSPLAMRSGAGAVLSGPRPAGKPAKAAARGTLPEYYTAAVAVAKAAEHYLHAESVLRDRDWGSFQRQQMRIERYHRALYILDLRVQAWKAVLGG